MPDSPSKSDDTHRDQSAASSESEARGQQAASSASKERSGAPEGAPWHAQASQGGGAPPRKRTQDSEAPSASGGGRPREDRPEQGSPNEDIWRSARPRQDDRPPRRDRDFGGSPRRDDRGGYGGPPRRDDRPPRRDYDDRPPRRDFRDRPPRRDRDFDGPPRRDDRGGYGGPHRRDDRPPRRDYDDRPPRRDYDDRPPRRDFDGPPRRDDRPPRRDYDDRPPRRDYDDRGPRRDYDDRGPRRDYDDRGPRRDFRDRPPRRDRDFDGPPRRDDRGGYGGPPRDDRGPRRDFNDRPPRRDFNDRPPRREGDGPPRGPRRFDGPPREGGGGPRRFDGPPRGPRRDDQRGGPARGGARRDERPPRRGDDEDRDFSPGMVRLRAIRTLDKIGTGFPADLALDRLFTKWEDADPRDRGLVHEIVMGVLRHRRLIDHALDPLLDRPIAALETEAREGCRVGLYQLYFLDRIPDHAAIGETVDLLKFGAKKYVNAILREAQRRGRAILDPPEKLQGLARLALERSAPDWIADYLKDFFGEEEAAGIIERSQVAPPLTIRLNATKNKERGPLVERLMLEGFPEAAPCEVSPVGIKLGSAGGMGSPKDWFFLKEGIASVQDEASQIAGLLMGAKPGERLLDYCAAPGGKAALMAEQMDGAGMVVACDRTEPKLRRVRKLSKSLDLESVIRPTPTPPENDMWPFEGILAGPLFDGILVDAPCAGLGTMARRPDVKWAKKREDLERLAEVQLAILKKVWPRLRPGGRLVYSTCTLGPVENQDVVAAFLKDAKDAAVKPPAAEEFPWLKPELLTPEGYFQSTGSVGGMDGFFAARLEKKLSTL